MFGWLKRPKSVSVEPWAEYDPVGDTPDGWSSLFRHPRDGSLWERTYAQGQMHGGGPVSFKKIGLSEAQQKYGFN
ncbi:hypothetical protein ASF31_04085 [Brevundimonas sp. Leaf280]|uniref:Imm27 family immunity protein n=1 Tax=Brevundimonas sp. Leaf280 TaxID=1736320 RepID=UPI0006FB2E7C|nr:Imm27 family immunity protein [Brevundimonas sp. Leaf280]KQP46411.1 hypothetical protein ASF31_04085 [Brevundimonas sp. Leaf280]